MAGDGGDRAGRRWAQGVGARSRAGRPGWRELGYQRAREEVKVWRQWWKLCSLAGSGREALDVGGHCS